MNWWNFSELTWTILGWNIGMTWVEDDWRVNAHDGTWGAMRTGRECLGGFGRSREKEEWRKWNLAWVCKINWGLRRLKAESKMKWKTIKIYINKIHLYQGFENKAGSIGFYFHVIWASELVFPEKRVINKIKPSSFKSLWFNLGFIKKKRDWDNST